MKKLIGFFILLSAFSAFAYTVDDKLENITIPDKYGVEQNAGRLEDVYANYPGLRSVIRTAIKNYIENKSGTANAARVYRAMIKAESFGVTFDATKRSQVVAARNKWNAEHSANESE